MITVEGFTAVQRELADRLWALDSPDEVQGFIQNLPTKWLRLQGHIVQEMLVAAYIDTVVAEMPQFPEAETVVDSLAKRS